jgi:NAD(P)-dependent dehydrogenase (short-subunit alcohol dehydrogenase family)
MVGDTSSDPKEVPVPDQRIALITGGNRGIGRSAAIHLAKDGVDSVITYRSHADEAAEVVAEIEALGRQAAALQLDTGDSSSF